MGSPLKRAMANATSTPTAGYSLSGAMPHAIRLKHPYLIHVTSAERADMILEQKRLEGAFDTRVTLAQDLRQCVPQAQHKGVALIFEWEGSHDVGDAMPEQRNVAYHHVNFNDVHIETYILKGSTAKLFLVAIALAGKDCQYSDASVLAKPITISVEKALGEDPPVARRC